jgi:hypothetical protein
MSSIAAPAVHLSAETGTGKSPVSSGTAAGIAKGDFRVHLAVVKTTAKFTAPANAESGTAMPAETDEAATAAVLTGNTSLSAAADTMVALPAPTPQGSGAANAKRLRRQPLQARRSRPSPPLPSRRQRCNLPKTRRLRPMPA